MGDRTGWSDEKHAKVLVNEFICRDLLSEGEAEDVAARLADDEPMAALREALSYTRSREYDVRNRTPPPEPK